MLHNPVCFLFVSSLQVVVMGNVQQGSLHSLSHVVTEVNIGGARLSSPSDLLDLSTLCLE